MDISDVTENSFTLNRKFERPENIEYPQANGDVTFKIVFDENAQDWRIEQKMLNMNLIIGYCFI